MPSTRTALSEAVLESPMVTLFELFVTLVFGWPGYLLANFSGPAKYVGKRNSHIDPGAALFTGAQSHLIALSVVGLLMAGTGLASLGKAIGWGRLGMYYGVPLLLVNASLVLITYLQHSDVYVPHYTEATFTWLRGALSTVDRPFFSSLGNAATHHIADSHVAHHLFSTMPWYHAVLATPVLAKFLGPYYMVDNTPTPTALWNSWRGCKYVVPGPPGSTGPCFYVGSDGLGRDVTKTAARS